LRGILFAEASYGDERLGHNYIERVYRRFFLACWNLENFNRCQECSNGRCQCGYAYI